MSNTYSLDLEAGSTQFARIADASQTGLDLSGDFTIETWFKLESSPSGGLASMIVTKSDYASDNAYEFGIRDVSGTPRFEITIRSAGDYDQVRWGSVSVPTGTWTHVAVVCTIANAIATEFELFINGVSQGNGSSTHDGSVGSIRNSAAPFTVGGSGETTATDLFDGLIDDLRVWSATRSSSQISSYYQVQLTGSESNLVGYWRFNNSYADQTSNANTLTATGSPVFSTDVPFTDQSGFFYMSV